MFLLSSGEDRYGFPRFPVSARVLPSPLDFRCFVAFLGLIFSIPSHPDFFFRPLAGVLRHRTQITQGDPRRRDTVAYRSLGCSYRSEKLDHMGMLQNT